MCHRQPRRKWTAAPDLQAWHSLKTQGRKARPSASAQATPGPARLRPSPTAKSRMSPLGPVSSAASPGGSDSGASVPEDWGQGLIDNLENMLGVDLDGNGTHGDGHGLMDELEAGEKQLVNLLEDMTGLDIDGEHTQS